MTNYVNKKGRVQMSRIGFRENILYHCFGISSSRYEAVIENKYVTFYKWALIVALAISFVIATVILCMDVDLLKNGPTYFLAKFLVWIRDSSDSDYEENVEHYYEELIESRRALWIHMPMMGVLIACSTVIFMCILGCVAGVTLSYTMIAGFSAFMLVATVISSFLLLWVFYGDMQGTVADKFAMKKIAQYNCSTRHPNLIYIRDSKACDNSFDKIIDYIQINMACCGFKSSDDWGDYYPPSCCLPCNAEPTTCIQPCQRQNIHSTPCLESMRMSSLRPDMFVGRIGIVMVAIVSFMGLSFILSFILCLLVRAHRTLQSEQDSQLELADNFYGKKSNNKTSNLLDKYYNLGIGREKHESNRNLANNRSMSLYPDVTTDQLLHGDPDMTYSQHRRNTTLY